MSSEPLLILGDFNIHMDLPDDTDCRNMSDLLVSMGLKQHVLQPTHELGHTLDLIITRISDNIIAGRPYTGELFSDHFPVFSQLKPERPLVVVKHLQFRNIKSIDRDQVSEAICSSQLCLEPPDDLDTLVNCYNGTLRSVLDIYAPVLILLFGLDHRGLMKISGKLNGRDEGLKRSGELLDYLPILLLLKRKEIVW